MVFSSDLTIAGNPLKIGSEFNKYLNLGAKRGQEDRTLLFLSASTYNVTGSVELTLQLLEGSSLLEEYKIIQLIAEGSVIPIITVVNSNNKNKLTYNCRFNKNGNAALAAVRKSTTAKNILTYQEYLDISNISNVVVLYINLGKDKKYDLEDPRIKTIKKALVAPRSAGQPNGNYRTELAAAGKVPPDMRGTHTNKQQNYADLLQNSSQSLSLQLTGWGSSLSEVHASSELPVISDIVNSEVALAYTDYTLHLGSAMNLVTRAAEERTKLLGVGNIATETTAAIHQKNHSFRIESNTTADLVAPLVTLTGQSILSEFKGQHCLGYFSQESLVHKWTRAEQSLTQVSDNIINYSNQNYNNFSANHSVWAGNSFNHSDYLFLQVGTKEEIPLSEESLEGDYGSLEIYTQNNLRIRAKQQVELDSKTLKASCLGYMFITTRASAYMTGRPFFLNSAFGRSRISDTQLIQSKEIKPLEEIKLYPRTTTPKDGSFITDGVTAKAPTD